MKYSKTGEVKLDGNPTHLSWNCNGSLLAVSTGQIYDLHKMQLNLDSMTSMGYCNFSNNNPYLLATINGTELKVWDIRTRSPKSESYQVLNSDRLMFSFDDTTIVLFDSTDIHFYKDGDLLKSIQGTDCCYINPETMMITTTKGTIQIYHDWLLVHEMKAHSTAIQSIQLDQKGRYLYTVSTSCEALKWDITQMLPMQSFESPDLQQLKIDINGLVGIVGKSKSEVDGKIIDSTVMEFNPRYECFAYTKQRKLCLVY